MNSKCGITYEKSKKKQLTAKKIPKTIVVKNFNKRIVYSFIDSRSNIKA